MWELLRHNVQFFGKALGQELGAEARKQAGNSHDLPENGGLGFFGIGPCIRDFQTELKV